MGCSTSALQVLGSSHTVGLFSKADVVELRQRLPPTLFARYDLGEVIGSGSFAQVRSATKIVSMASKEDEALQYVVKVIDLRSKRDSEKLSAKQREVATMEALMWRRALLKPCDHIVRFEEVFFESHMCYLVLEKCDSPLWPALQQLPKFDEVDLGALTHQMLEALMHLHKVGIVHRDIKPDNILCQSLGLENEKPHYKLCDFGLATSLLANGRCQSDKPAGTAPYMAPEMFCGVGYDAKVDEWSLGVVIYTLLYGTFPYLSLDYTSKAVKKAIKTGYPGPKFMPAAGLKECASSRSLEALSFVSSLLERTPSSRLAATKALSHPFIMQVTRADAGAMLAGLPSLRPALLYIMGLDVAVSKRVEKADRSGFSHGTAARIAGHSIREEVGKATVRGSAGTSAAFATSTSGSGGKPVVSGQVSL